MCETDHLLCPSRKHSSRRYLAKVDWSVLTDILSSFVWADVNIAPPPVSMNSTHVYTRPALLSGVWALCDLVHKRHPFLSHETAAYAASVLRCYCGRRTGRTGGLVGDVQVPYHAAENCIDRSICTGIIVCSLASCGKAVSKPAKWYRQTPLSVVFWRCCGAAPTSVYHSGGGLTLLLLLNSGLCRRRG